MNDRNRNNKTRRKLSEFFLEIYAIALKMYISSIYRIEHSSNLQKPIDKTERNTKNSIGFTYTISNEIITSIEQRQVNHKPQLMQTNMQSCKRSPLHRNFHIFTFCFVFFISFLSHLWLQSYVITGTLEFCYFLVFIAHNRQN